MQITTSSTLEKSGITNTAKLMHDFAGIYVQAIKSHFNETNLVARLHSFRKGGAEGIKLTIHTNVSTNDPFVIVITTRNGGPAIDGNYTYLSDMAESLHFVGIITTALNAPLKVGSLKLEANKKVTMSDTSSILNLWR